MKEWIKLNELKILLCDAELQRETTARRSQRPFLVSTSQRSLSGAKCFARRWIWCKTNAPWQTFALLTEYVMCGVDQSTVKAVSGSTALGPRGAKSRCHLLNALKNWHHASISTYLPYYQAQQVSTEFDAPSRDENLKI